MSSGQHIIRHISVGTGHGRGWLSQRSIFELAFDLVVEVCGQFVVGWGRCVLALSCFVLFMLYVYASSKAPSLGFWLG